MEFQEIMRKIRKEHSYTQQTMADVFNIPRSTYKSYETGVATPSPYFLTAFADYFNITVDELLGRTTAPQLFDDARIERPEVLELFDSLTPDLQAHALAYLHGLADRSAAQNGAHVNVAFVADNKRKNI